MPWYMYSYNVNAMQYIFSQFAIAAFYLIQSLESMNCISRFRWASAAFEMQYYPMWHMVSPATVQLEPLFLLKAKVYRMYVQNYIMDALMQKAKRNNKKKWNSKKMKCGNVLKKYVRIRHRQWSQHFFPFFFGNAGFLKEPGNFWINLRFFLGDFIQ